MSGRRQKRAITGVGVMIAVMVAVAGARLMRVAPAEAVSGCCSRHKGVCGCECCDGSPLSETCRSRMPKCGGEKGAETARGQKKAFEGKVVGIMDGDTIEVMRNGKPTRVRLADIDCPEKSQAFGTRAKKLTSQLAFGKIVKIEVRAIDRYGRTVADVILPDGKSLNREILRAGLAWWYRDFSKDKQLGAIEEEARRARRGLWSDPDPLPPWVYRRSR